LEELRDDLLLYNIAWFVPVIGPAITAGIVYESASNGASPLYTNFFNEVVKDPSVGVYKYMTDEDRELSHTKIIDGTLRATKYFGIPNTLIKPLWDATRKYMEGGSVSMKDVGDIIERRMVGRTPEYINENEQ
jgi:hypothetical protein